MEDANIQYKCGEGTILHHVQVLKYKIILDLYVKVTGCLYICISVAKDLTYHIKNMVLFYSVDWVGLFSFLDYFWGGFDHPPKNNPN